MFTLEIILQGIGSRLKCLIQDVETACLHEESFEVKGFFPNSFLLIHWLSNNLSNTISRHPFDNLLTGMVPTGVTSKAMVALSKTMCNCATMSLIV